MTDNSRMKFIVLIVAAFSVMLFADPARANIDQHCLSLCVASGENSSSCMDKCVYQSQEEKPKSNAIPNAASKSLTDPHNVLHAPVPTGDLLLPTKQKKQAKPRSKDYVCLNACLQNGGQYALCNKTCTRAECTTGDPTCNDLMGRAASPLAPTTTQK
jgi:hypothetical protein